MATTPHFRTSRSSGFSKEQLWTSLLCLSRSRRLRCVRVVGRSERAFGDHVLRFSYRRRCRPQLLHDPRWLTRGILQVHSSASVQSATARDEGASGAATIHALGYWCICRIAESEWRSLLMFGVRIAGLGPIP